MMGGAEILVLLVGLLILLAVVGGIIGAIIWAVKSAQKAKGSMEEGRRRHAEMERDLDE